MINTKIFTTPLCSLAMIACFATFGFGQSTESTPPATGEQSSVATEDGSATIIVQTGGKEPDLALIFTAAAETTAQVGLEKN